MPLTCSMSPLFFGRDSCRAEKSNATSSTPVTRDSANRCHRFSLSPRERVGVRGKGTPWKDGLLTQLRAVLQAVETNLSAVGFQPADFT